MKKYEIEADTLQAVLTYLNTCPMGAVRNLVSKLEQEIAAQNQPAKDKGSK